MRSWPRFVSLALGLVPVLILALIVVTLAVRARPALDTVGWHQLISTHFSSQYSSGAGKYGLVPAVSGTLLLVAIAMSIALPVSLAFAVFASEIATGIPGKATRAILGVMSGIPPIVYALMSIVFIAPFIAPKFTAGFTFSQPDPARIGIAADQFPPARLPWSAGALPWDPSGLNNSTLLGGILLALLVIPFMAPLIEDALQNVPGEPKQASLALGAGRWQTLRRITLPHAASGIVSAVRLGVLKVVGDVMIALFVVGYEASHLPNPAWDILERTPPITATGVGLIGGFQGPKACTPTDCAVGYFSALVLLVLALAVVTITTVLERRFRRRYA